MTESSCFAHRNSQTTAPAQHASQLADMHAARYCVTCPIVDSRNPHGCTRSAAGARAAFPARERRPRGRGHRNVHPKSKRFGCGPSVLSLIDIVFHALRGPEEQRGRFETRTIRGPEDKEFPK